MVDYGTNLIVHCQTGPHDSFVDDVTHPVEHGTVGSAKPLVNYPFMVNISSDADPSKGTEGNLSFTIGTARFGLKYVCNNQLNNGVIVTAPDGFEVTISPAPDALKTAAPLLCSIDIKRT